MVEDDSTIGDQDGLLRHVPSWPTMFKYDENLRVYRATSACFTDRDGGTELSVTLEQPLLQDGGVRQDVVKDNPGFGVARIEAGFVRHSIVPAQKVVRAPTGADPYHGLVVGPKNKIARKRMAKQAVLVIVPKA